MKKLLWLSLCLFTGSCSKLVWWYDNYPSDNIAEELLEEYIESETGMEVDLSPFSKENKKVEIVKWEL